MTNTAPYNTPSVLARVPLMALFWTMIAPFLFQILIFTLASTVMPEGVKALSESDDPTSLQTIWLVFVISNALLFMVLSIWTETIGAGPFAGSMFTNTNWLIMAVALGPVVLHGSGILVSNIFSNGDPNWLYRGEDPPAFIGPMGFGMMMVLFTVVLAPLVEEVAFRGVALGCLLARGWQPLPAALLTSAAFSALHFQYVLPAMIPVFIVAMFMAWLRIQSGSVVAPILAHMAANGASMLLFWQSLDAAT